MLERYYSTRFGKIEKKNKEISASDAVLRKMSMKIFI